MGFGDYAEGYNRHIHGPYDPSRYYGKPDTPFGEVKLRDLLSWLSRRSMNPVKWTQATSRAFHRWQDKWIHPKRPSPAGIYQLMILVGLAGYINNFPKHYAERQRKYH